MKQPEKNSVTRFGRRFLPPLRTLVQMAFLGFVLVIGWQFYLFFLWATGEKSHYVARPPAVEGFLPIGALVGLKRLLVTGRYDMVHPAGLTILLAAIAIALVARKGFCGWICPVGAVSNLAEKAGRRFGVIVTTPRWLNYILSSVKYLLVVFFVGVIFFRMSAEAIIAFHGSKYNIVADAKMLLFFLEPGPVAAGVLVVLCGLSFFVVNPWCRWLCPYGALLGLFARVSLVDIGRDRDACIACKKCDSVCPAVLPVSRKAMVRDNACIGCMECVAACPVAECLTARAAGRPISPLLAVGAGIVIFFAFWVWARSTGHWFTGVEDRLFQELYPLLRSFGHPSF